MYRAHALHLLLIAFVIYLAAAIIEGLLSLAGGFVVTLITSVIGLLAAYLVQAALVKAVQDIRDGRADLSLSETLSAGLPAVLPVAAASILAAIAITIGLILIIVPGLYLITIWAVIVPVIVIERSGALQSFGRSQSLVKGRGWNVFGTLVLVFIILIVLEIVLGAVFAFAPRALATGLSTVVSGTLVAPFLALVVTLIYYRLVGAPAGDGGYGQPPAGGYGQPGYGQPGSGYPPPADGSAEYPPSGPPPSYPPSGPPPSYPPSGPPPSYPPSGPPPSYPQGPPGPAGPSGAPPENPPPGSGPAGW
jgi:hypothetical protein